MRLQIVEDGKLVEYERTGTCNRCGECCRKNITFCWDVQKASSNEQEEVEEDWSAYEGYSLIYKYGVFWYFFIKSVEEKDPRCTYFREGLCTVHDDPYKRPVLCDFWPVHPQNLVQFPDCSYRFERCDLLG